MKRIPKIIAAACAAAVLSASMVLVAVAAAPTMSKDDAPANCPVTGAAMPRQDSMMKGSMMQGGQMGSMRMDSMRMDSMLSEEDSGGHKGGHGDGHNRAAGMNGMNRMGQVAMLDRSL